MSEAHFDTNILIDWLKDHPLATAELAGYRRHRISRIVWTELVAGEPAATRPALMRLLNRFDLVEIDADVALLAADFRHRSRVKLLDALIYATAQRHGSILVTRNTKDFAPGLPGIHIPYTL